MPCALISDPEIKLRVQANYDMGGNKDLVFKVQAGEETPVSNLTSASISLLVLSSNQSYNIDSMWKGECGATLTSLTYTVTKDDNSNLPLWIIHDSVNKLLNVTTDIIGTQTVKMIATTTSGLVGTQYIYFGIYNNAPTLNSSDTLSQQIYENQTFDKTVNFTNQFIENDANQVLTFTLISSPTFITNTNINQGDKTIRIQGQASLTDVGGTHAVIIEASDSFDTVQATLTINIVNNNPPTAPVGFVTSITAKEDNLIESTVFTPFTDGETDTITYSMKFKNDTAFSAFSWINFDPSTRNLTYNVINSLSTPVELKFIAEDPYNAAVTVDVNISIKYSPTDNPAIVARTKDIIALFPTKVSINRDIIMDKNSNIASYNITFATNGSAIPSWLVVTYPNTSTSGNFEIDATYPTFESKTIVFTINANDTDGLEGSANFTIQVKSK